MRNSVFYFLAFALFPLAVRESASKSLVVLEDLLGSLELDGIDKEGLLKQGGGQQKDRLYKKHEAHSEEKGSYSSSHSSGGDKYEKRHEKHHGYEQKEHHDEGYEKPHDQKEHYKKKLDHDHHKKDEEYHAVENCREYVNSEVSTPEDCAFNRPKESYNDGPIIGKCRWDHNLAKINKAGACLCPRTQVHCYDKNIKHKCYWHKDSHEGYGEKPESGGHCISNAEKFYNVLHKLLLKRGKKDFAIRINYNAIPAVGHLPYGPHGPSVIKLATPIGYGLNPYGQIGYGGRRLYNHPISTQPSPYIRQPQSYGSISSYPPIADGGEYAAAASYQGQTSSQAGSYGAGGSAYQNSFPADGQYSQSVQGIFPYGQSHQNPEIYSAQQPIAYGAQQPGAYGAQQPGAYGAQQPGAYGAQQPGAYGAQQPGAYGAQQPGAYGAQQPGAYGAQQPGAYGAQQPGAYGVQQPGAYGAQQPGAYGAQQPGVYGTQQPGAYGAQQPGAYGVQQPGAYGTQQPGAYGAQQPGAFGAQQPGAFGAQQPGAFGAQQPDAYGAQQPEIFGQGPVLSQAEAYAQTPLQAEGVYGQNAAAYGQADDGYSSATGSQVSGGFQPPSAPIAAPEQSSYGTSSSTGYSQDLGVVSSQYDTQNQALQFGAQHPDSSQYGLQDQLPSSPYSQSGSPYFTPLSTGPQTGNTNPFSSALNQPQGSNQFY